MAASTLFAGNVAAIDFNVTGFVREEVAYSVSSNENRNNLMQSQWNDRIVPHLTNVSYGTPDALGGTNGTDLTSVYRNAAGTSGFFTLADGGLNGANRLPAGRNTSSPVGCRLGYENAKHLGATGFFGTNTFFGTACPGADGIIHGTNNTGNGNSNIIAGVNGGQGGAGVVSNNNANQAANVAALAAAGYGSTLNDDIDFNMFNSRVEIDVQAKINDEFAAYMKFRAYYDGSAKFTDGLIEDNFGNPYWGSRRATLTEFNTPSFMLDVPALYLDWNRGPLWLRLGNQTIAWGEAYFFRVMDVANGLDLRRHLALGPGAEEYQDQRVASPAIRLSYTFNNGWEIDAFAQMFNPTVLPGQNTPYNVAGFSVYLDEEESFDDAKNAINYGARLTMPFTDQLTGMLAYVNRRNPDGVVVGAEAPTHWRGFNNPFCLGQFNDTNNLLTALGLQGALAPTGTPAMPSLAPGSRVANKCGTSFSPDPYAANSHEVIDNVATARIDVAHYFTTQINEFPASKWATRDIFGFGDEATFVDVMRTSEGFRSSFGGITQWVTRQWKRENIFVVGGNYIVNAEDPNSIFDQLIIRGEVSYTPDKKLTNDLSFNLTEKDDIVSALILEKYQRFSDAFPATYMVAQWMHRTATDMFGRDLDKNGTRTMEDFIDPVTGRFNDLARTPGALTPDGNSSADYVVFAFQQPFPNLIWRFDFAVLVDTAGGYLVQPGVRFRPSAKWQWDLYANVIESPGGQNDTITETLDWADEIFARVTYFF